MITSTWCFKYTCIICSHWLGAAQQESAIALKNLIDCTNKHVRALQALGRPTKYWDDILVHLVSTKLSPEMRKTWEIESTSYVNFPPWHNLGEFIENRVHALEIMQFRHCPSKPKTTTKTVSQATMVRQQDSKKVTFTVISTSVYGVGTCTWT
ncbi:unnamed protein product [Macrosiphum euphorbiae]|uniref:Uncharacterized protein n=1 Tax=Macrosiphum euphorbiae TaxID=13131 RepID=A0AAV0XQ84_9HEMI|nr:unnamed protein product [Macrosiphum euphorbiae]